jgi:hypothetical protein
MELQLRRGAASYTSAQLEARLVRTTSLQSAPFPLIAHFQPAPRLHDSILSASRPLLGRALYATQQGQPVPQAMRSSRQPRQSHSPRPTFSASCDRTRSPPKSSTPRERIRSSPRPSRSCAPRPTMCGSACLAPATSSASILRYSDQTTS